MGVNRLGPLTGVLAIIAGLVLVGIILRLIVAILSPVLPTWLMRDLSAGWALLYSIISPAMAPIMAVGILVAVCWVVVARRR